MSLLASAGVRLDRWLIQLQWRGTELQVVYGNVNSKVVLLFARGDDSI